MEKYVDALILGGGPAGYVSAIRFAQLGQTVMIVEKEKIGGACLNRGCIPMKTLLSVAKTLKDIKKSDRMGIVVTDAIIDYQKVYSWNHSVMDRFRRGIEYLLKTNGIELIIGNAAMESSDTVFVYPQELTIKAKTILIATGSSPSDLPGMRFDSRHIISSDEIFELKLLPKSLLIVGGGIIGVEMATAFAEMGTKVTIVEIMDQLMPGWHKDVVVPVVDSLAKLGVEINLSARVLELKYRGENVIATIEGKTEIETEYVLVAVGRRPNTDDLNLTKAGVETDKRGYVKVNDRLETNVKGIFAAGDVIGIPYLAHRSSEQGYCIAEIASGLKAAYDYPPIPSVVYTDPEVAIIGMDESEAEEQGKEVLVGKFAFAASARAMTVGKLEGFVKVIGDRSTGKIIGAQIVGVEASDLISEFSLALKCSLTLEQIASAVHPHPTFSESVMEAARIAIAKPVHGAIKTKGH